MKERSQEYFEKSLSIPDDAVPPIFVPSYNRPNAKLLQRVLVEPDLKIVLCIRREQYEMYKAWEGKVFSIMLLDNVHDIGETRQQIVTKASQAYDYIFMFDDDISELGFFLPSTTSGGSLSRRASHLVSGYKPTYKQILKMWLYYISVMQVEIALSGIAIRSEAWNMSHNEQPLVYNSGAIIQAVYLNVKLLMQHNINYQSNDLVGAEDYGLHFDIMEKNLATVKFLDILYNCPPINSIPGGCDHLLGVTDPNERYNKMLEIERNRYGDHPGVLYKTNLNKTLVSMKLNWRYWRKRFEDYHTQQRQTK